jgi:hypothetical protein
MTTQRRADNDNAAAMQCRLHCQHHKDDSNMTVTMMLMQFCNGGRHH